MTTPVPTRRAKFTVANRDAEPTDAWIRAVAVMLLAHADRQIAAERATAETVPTSGDVHERRAS